MSPRNRAVEETKEEKEHKEEGRIKDLPKTQDFILTSELEGLREKIYDIKMNNSQTEFINKIKSVLALFDKDTYKYSYSIMLFVMQCVENYILKKGAGEYKQQVVIECVKEYFNNDETLVELSIPVLMPRLKQNKFIKRNIKRLFRFFSKCVLTRSQAE